MRGVNRLARASSPYLLQHAHNPVDWWEWGEGARAAAIERDVPIFLSVGYSTCYWCHVMERESFEDPATAEVLNRLFVAVKLDREERPDLDDAYMLALQALTGRGGWPMSVFLDPATLRPFHAGTYYPPEPRHGMPSFRQVLEAVRHAWDTRRADVIAQADHVAEALAPLADEAAPAVVLGPAHVERAVGSLLGAFDPVHGGFSPAPKFPQWSALELLLSARGVVRESEARSAIGRAVSHTLTRMALGGLRDQIGGGFHRYCVDATWTVPHFEKMLYDNALLADVYARAADELPEHRGFFLEVAAETALFMVREMGVRVPGAGEAGEEGFAFLSAIDAEAEEREGLTYVWTRAEVRGVLGGAGGEEEDARAAEAVFGFGGAANFTDPHHPDEAAAYVPVLTMLPGEARERFGAERVARIRAALLAHRAKRPQPVKDDKVLAGWNGLAIAACARVAGALRRHEHDVAAGVSRGAADVLLTAAVRAAEFVLTRMREARASESEAGSGAAPGLLRCFRAAQGKPEGGGRVGGGRAYMRAVLEDYAYVVRGVLALAREVEVGTGDAPAAARWVDAAEQLIGVAEARFSGGGDIGEGGGGGVYFDAAEEAEDLFLRPVSTHDGSVPSAMGVMIGNLLDLAGAAGRGRYAARAGAALAAVSGRVADAPVSCANSVAGLLRMLREHPGVLGEALARRGAAETESSPEPTGDAVRFFADTDYIEIGPDRPAEFRLHCRLAAGWHIIAADPGDEAIAPGAGDTSRRGTGSGSGGLTLLRVRVVGGTGVSAFAEYPPGVALSDAHPVLVHASSFTMRVAVEQTGAVSGRPRLAVTFQACTDRACAAARTVELDITIAEHAEASPGASRGDVQDGVGD